MRKLLVCCLLGAALASRPFAAEEEPMPPENLRPVVLRRFAVQNRLSETIDSLVMSDTEAEVFVDLYLPPEQGEMVELYGMWGAAMQFLLADGKWLVFENVDLALGDSFAVENDPDHPVLRIYRNHGQIAAVPGVAADKPKPLFERADESEPFIDEWFMPATAEDETELYDVDLPDFKLRVSASSDWKDGKGAIRLSVFSAGERILVQESGSSFENVRWGSWAFSGGGGSYIIFKIGRVEYIPFTAIGKWGEGGETQKRAGMALRMGDNVFGLAEFDDEDLPGVDPAFLESTPIPRDASGFELPDPDEIGERGEE